MSANNQVLIKKVNQVLIKKVGEKWRVMDSDVDCGGGRLIRDEPFETLEEAIKVANDYQKGGGVEYGLKIVLPRYRPITLSS